MTARIPLRRRDGSIRAYALVDAADREWLSGWRWCVGSSGYAERSETLGGRRIAFMHRDLLGLSRGDRLEADHINGDRLDNRRLNLRVVTRAQNAQNVPSRPGSSRHRGVSWSKGKGRWRAYAQLDGKQHSLGYFASEEEAAAAAARWRGEHMSYTCPARAAA